MQKEKLEIKLKEKLDELGSLAMEVESLSKRNAELTNEKRTSQQRADHFQQAYRELDSKRSEEIEALATEIHSSSAKEKDAVQRSIYLEKENDELKEQNRVARRELETNRSEFENMVKVMEDLETKINL